ncbi:MAG: DUF1285 domain-containing protein [Candidatus Rokubacteria bacterium]|nr:DUF1285 domain-containing protein [Candidatus Rokubacteria bacterium]HXG03863.1 hypothetical protein [Candidatus Binatia bacterium]
MPDPEPRPPADEAAAGEGWRLPRLRIDRDGEWYDDDVLITHPGLLANLRGNLRRDAQGYFIQTRVRIPVQVEDTPWVAVRAEPRGERIGLVLNDGSEEEIDPAAVRIGPGDVPYCRVKGGAFEARLSRAAAFQLLALADYDERTGRGTLRLGGRQFPLERA